MITHDSEPKRRVSVFVNQFALIAKQLFLSERITRQVEKNTNENKGKSRDKFHLVSAQGTKRKIDN